MSEGIWWIGIISFVMGLVGMPLIVIATGHWELLLFMPIFILIAVLCSNILPGDSDMGRFM